MADAERIRVKINGEEQTLRIIDEGHLWLGGAQYISLKRFYEARNEVNEELRMLNDKVIELTKENEAYRVLLKGTLGMDVVRVKGEEDERK